METIELSLSGLKLLRPRIFRDERGYFLESYRKPLFDALGVSPFVQDNLSFSYQNTIRALHYQIAPGQAKLVSCTRGKIFDVAVDIRPSSPTFGKWESVILDDETHAQLLIPVGFAHGYAVLSKEAIVQYKVSALYDPATERSIRWNDPEINVDWPISSPILSARDQTSPFFSEVVFA